MNSKMVTELDDVYRQCWSLLREGAENPTSTFRFPVLASSTASQVDARVVVLRHADELQRTLEFHTDKRSSKVAQISAHPTVLWVFYDPTSQIQLRVRSSATICGVRSLVDERWASLKEHTRRAYAQALDPGTQVEEILGASPCPECPDPELGRKNFSVVHCKVDRIEWLKLARSGHQAALFTFESAGWSSTWVMP